MCPALSNPVNGTVRTDNGATVNQTAIYECNSGYSLSGDSSRTCQLNASWSGDEPTCVLIGLYSIFQYTDWLINLQNVSFSNSSFILIPFAVESAYSCKKGT